MPVRISTKREQREESFFQGWRTFWLVVLGVSVLVVNSLLLGRSLDIHLLIQSLNFNVPESNSFGEGARFDKSESSSVDWESSFAYFYNIYIPPYDKKSTESSQQRDQALPIIQEQIDTVGSSDGRHLFPSLSIHYTTIGADDVLTDDWMREQCARNNLTCHHTNHYQEGHELLSLQAMYEHCQANLTKRVGYFHTKGLFHSKAYNGRSQHSWRRFGTLAVTSEVCMRPADDTCNVCGLTASGIPFPHFPGNFFAATCEYISKLIPPDSYEQKLTDIVRLERSLVMHTDRFVALEFADTDGRMGFGRHAGEHWILSSPESVPCDLDKDSKGASFFQRSKNVTRDYFGWGMYPRQGVGTPLFNRELKKKSTRVKDYFLLAGNILKWHHLYNKLPPEGSWVYRVFPDGDEWAEAVQQFGIHAQEVMVSRAANRKIWSVEPSK